MSISPGLVNFLQGGFGRTPDGFIKQIVLCVLLALNHLYSNCKIVHTGKSDHSSYDVLFKSGLQIGRH